MMVRSFSLIFAFAFVKDGRAVDDAASGILWIAISFSGTLALGRTFERERYGETLRALLLAPAPRAALYVGKLLGMLALLAIAEALLVPMVALMFQAALFSRPLLLVGLLAGGPLGFCAVGTLFAAMLMKPWPSGMLFSGGRLRPWPPLPRRSCGWGSWARSIPCS